MSAALKVGFSTQPINPFHQASSISTSSGAHPGSDQLTNSVTHVVLGAPVNLERPYHLGGMGSPHGDR